MGHSGANFSIACSTWLCISELGAVGKCDQGEQYPQCKLSLSEDRHLGELRFAYPTKF